MEDRRRESRAVLAVVFAKPAHQWQWPTVQCSRERDGSEPPRMVGGFNDPLDDISHWWKATMATATSSGPASRQAVYATSPISGIDRMYARCRTSSRRASRLRGGITPTALRYALLPKFPAPAPASNQMHRNSSLSVSSRIDHLPGVSSSSS